jgi:nucleotide-binding universal stress UspA family protein
MTTETHSGPDPTLDLDARAVFRRVLVGVDRSAASLEAARQAALLCDADGVLTLLAAWTLTPPLVETPGGFDDGIAALAREDAEAAVAAAQDALERAPACTQVVYGYPWHALAAEIEDQHVTLVAVGSHGTGRLSGILLGSTTTEIVHNTRCSVLVARPAPLVFPRRIVAGVDGSPGSAAAFAVARYLAERHRAELWPVVAHGGKGVAEQLALAIVGHRHEDLPDEPVRALVAASADADLLVVGSRGLHGIRALGSVSERVAHRARCSVLVVRGLPAEPADAS